MVHSSTCYVLINYLMCKAAGWQKNAGAALVCTVFDEVELELRLIMSHCHLRFLLPRMWVSLPSCVAALATSEQAPECPDDLEDLHKAAQA